MPLRWAISSSILCSTSAAVGPISYDLSTFLLRFPSQYRRCILELYRCGVAPAGWDLPPAAILNQLFETAELARFANMIIWPAIALLRDPSGWGWERLAAIEQWLDDMQPVLLSKQTDRAFAVAVR